MLRMFRVAARLVRGLLRLTVWIFVLLGVFLGGLWAVRAVSDAGAEAQFAVIERHCQAAFAQITSEVLAERPELQAAQAPVCALEFRRPWTIFAAFTDSAFVREDVTVRVSQNIATVYRSNGFACFMGPAKCRAAPISSEIVLTARQLR